MAVRPIVIYGDPVLREVARPVEEVDAETKALVDDLIATLKNAKGLGLAAPQIGVSRRVFVVDLSSLELTESLRVFINPEIIERSGKILLEEGCLSFPGMYHKIERPETAKIKAIDLEGQEFETEVSGMLARAILHECDHLEGKLFIDYLTPLTRTLIKGKLNKFKKMAAAS